VYTGAHVHVNMFFFPPDMKQNKSNSVQEPPTCTYTMRCELVLQKWNQMLML